MTVFPQIAWRHRIFTTVLLIMPLLAAHTSYAAPQRDTITWEFAAGTAQGRLLAAWVNETPSDYITTRVMWQRGTEAPVVVARRLQPLYRAKLPLCADMATKTTAAYGAVSDDYTELVHVDASTGTVTRTKAESLGITDGECLYGAAPQGWVVASGGSALHAAVLHLHNGTTVPLGSGYSRATGYVAITSTHLVMALTKDNSAPTGAKEPVQYRVPLTGGVPVPIASWHSTAMRTGHPEINDRHTCFTVSEGGIVREDKAVHYPSVNFPPPNPGSTRPTPTTAPTSTSPSPSSTLPYPPWPTTSAPAPTTPRPKPIWPDRLPHFTGASSVHLDQVVPFCSLRIPGRTHTTTFTLQRPDGATPLPSGTSFTGDTHNPVGTRSHVAFGIGTTGTVVTSATGAVATMTRPITDLISDGPTFWVITKADDGSPALGTVAGDGVVTIVTTLPQAVS